MVRPDQPVTQNRIDSCAFDARSETERKETARSKVEEKKEQAREPDRPEPEEASRLISTRKVFRLILQVLVGLVALCLLCILCAYIWQPATYYAVLGVEPLASQQQLKAAYRRMVLENHPDKAGDDPRAHENYIQIQAAYETLSRDHTRCFYDLDNGIWGRWAGDPWACDDLRRGYERSELTRIYEGWLQKRQEEEEEERHAASQARREARAHHMQGSGFSSEAYPDHGSVAEGLMPGSRYAVALAASYAHPFYAVSKGVTVLMLWACWLKVRTYITPSWI